MKTTELITKLHKLNYVITFAKHDENDYFIVTQFDVEKYVDGAKVKHIATIYPQDKTNRVDFTPNFSLLLNKQEQNEFNNLIHEFNKTELADRN